MYLNRKNKIGKRVDRNAKKNCDKTAVSLRYWLINTKSKDMVGWPVLVPKMFGYMTHYRAKKENGSLWWNALPDVHVTRTEPMIYRTSRHTIIGPSIFVLRFVFFIFCFCYWFVASLFCLVWDSRRWLKKLWLFLRYDDCFTHNRDVISLNSPRLDSVWLLFWSSCD